MSTFRQGGWYYTMPDGHAVGPFNRWQIQTRWRRYRIIRANAPPGHYVPRLLAWSHAAIDPFVGQ